MHLTLVSLVAGAAALSLAPPAPISDREIVSSLLNNPILLPRSSHKLLQARAAQLDPSGTLTRRQFPGGLGGAGGAPKLDIGSLLGLLSPKGNGPQPVPPNSSVPEVRNVPAKGTWKDPGAKAVKIRYGPYRIPPTSEKNFESEVLNVQGMANTFKMGAKKPCTGECTILAIFADLEYADGSPATNANGAWFHHTVLLNSGPKVLEPNCGTGRVENIFMSGNERTTGGFALPDAKIKSGYSITAADSFILSTELMNMQNMEKWVWLTIHYEYLDGPHPDYRQGKTLWMTIGPEIRCPGTNITSPWGPSNLTMSQQPKTEVFSEHSFPWRAPQPGLILGTGGHMHDGGVGVEIFKNSELICNSVPHYTKSTGHGMGGMRRRQLKGGDYNNLEILHIEKQDPCNFPDGIPLQKGDTMH